MDYVETSNINITVTKWKGPMLPFYDTNTKKLYIKIMDGDSLFNLIENKNKDQDKISFHEILDILLKNTCEDIYKTYKLNLLYQSINIKSIKSINEILYAYCNPYYGKEYIILCINNIKTY
jgi:hypothetical protein